MGIFDGADAVGSSTSASDFRWPWQQEGVNNSADWTRQNLNPETRAANPTPNDLVNDPSTWGIGGTIGPASDASRQAANDYKWQQGQKALETLAIRPYRFNAPLHPVIRSARSRKGTGGSPYDMSYGPGELQVDWPEDAGRKPWRWRLGQMVADMSSSAYKPGEFRYGFRFLYNPSTMDFSTPLSNKYSPKVLADMGGGDLNIMPQGSISLDLLLNRIPDVNTPVSNYGSPVPPEDLKEIRARGTMYDIDYLYRMMNGVWTLDPAADTGDAGKPARSGGGKNPHQGSDSDRDRQTRKKKKPKEEDEDPKEGIVDVGTVGWPYSGGDIGFLLPTTVWLSIGKSIRYYGWIQSVSYEHQMFSDDMIPILTRVSISFARILMGSQEQFKAINEATAVANTAEGDNFEASSPDAGGGGGGGVPGTGAAVGVGYPDPKAKNQSNPEYIWASFLRYGFSKASAAGIMGNLQQESGDNLDPGAIQDGGPGRGIAQWTEGDRWATCQSWCKNKKYDPWSLQGQVGYLLHEIEEANGDYGSIQKYKQFSDPVEAAVYFHDKFERSADSDSFVRSVRGGNAKRWYQKFKDWQAPQADDASAPKSGSTVYILGDSLTVGSKPYIEKKFKSSSDLNYSIHAETGRFSYELGLLDTEAASKAYMWIIALGTNDGAAGAVETSVHKVMQKANGKTVRWINVYLDDRRSLTKNINDMLDSMAQKYSNLTIIDFAGRVSQSDLANDGVHLNANGYRKRAELYVPTTTYRASSISKRVGV